MSTVAESTLPRAMGTGDLLTRGELLAVKLKSIPRPSHLRRSISVLTGVGPKVKGRAKTLGIETVGDLVEHIPVRHEGFRLSKGIGELATGQEATLLVEVRSCRLRPTRRRNLRLLECEVADVSGSIRAVWFNQEYLLEQFKSGTRLLIQGQLTRSKKGLTFQVRAHEPAERRNGRAPVGLHTVGLVPVYPATEGLPVRRIRDMAWQAGVWCAHTVEPLPSGLRMREGIPCRSDALSAVHFPRSLEEAEAGRHRLAFEELFLLQLALGVRRRSRRLTNRAEAQPPPGEVVRTWLESRLPFQLTDDQRQAIDEIEGDLRGKRPMQRLLMGEVGSGKTVVALYTMLRAAEAGGQAALMAPTETLAEQHFRTVEALVGGSERIALLTKATSARKRSELLKQLASGELRLVVGTHALLEGDVEFQRLTVAVVDEQHRFGVAQRKELDCRGREGISPHMLHMSATPIPRTLALTIYGDLDTTVLRELPVGRQPVKTWVIPEEKRSSGCEFIRERLREGRQCYVVCPLVEESEALQAKAATVEAERLANGEFADFRVEVLHGQMPSKTKQGVMDTFVAGDIDVLVATSVVEVGIDVPNASVMVIEAAERYGLSQLHQLRGRVGRGEHESYCLLFGNALSEQAKRRLKAMTETTDGFKLAEVDLALRGEGEILGDRQSGLPEFKFVELPVDYGLLSKARGWAERLLDADPSLDDPQHALLETVLAARFGGAETEPIPA